MLINRKISVAPMVAITDEHFRYMIRLLSKKVTLYTPMISAKSIIMGNLNKVVKQTPTDSPIAIQIATSCENDAAKAIEILENKFNFDEYNLNVGCPSSKVQNANYGACLMQTPTQVGKILKAMKKNTNKPVSIKHRIGIRNNKREYHEENYTELQQFVEKIMEYEIKNFTVHARIAILNGYSPKDNQNIPKLRHDFVYRLKQEHKNIFIEVNGGIKSSDHIKTHLSYVDSVMIGRAVAKDPYLIAKISREFLEEKEKIPTREEILLKMVEYIKEYDECLSISTILKHIMSIVFAKENACKFRQTLSAPFPKNLKNHEILLSAIEHLREDTLKSNS
ncbi:tRNA dihydrouridine(20/20a) synthase DusA [Borrelia hermsii]|uniref:tRNA-dihydrouridine synthase n=3 Tax=Borrelia hermsii TaxID=140 RepID=A0AAN0X5R0_BORHE|nr:tRNA dihydrouridine(20/20a) synthase DusA [Borrelia hermsii]AAX16740.1 NIFR3-like protein [Borrelia hermsii DAH]AJW73041.1 tRNA-dihydrouridine synthase A [Borrelia hermsii CC1]AMR75603.1 tRNA-dihydrouridine synthase A [Borrelia hermsii]ANA43038.1 tRNA-dihydrouridine synthase A [Borrelia hermsii HS1]UCP01253.1 tRNA dihydrouridine(20/20a) synthase DusA [Borrelia hermsii]